MESNILTENQLPNEVPKRPQFLTVLCILSFIWSGFLLLCLVLGLCFSGLIFSAIEKLQSGAEGMPPMGETQQQALQTLIDIGPQKFIMGIAIAIIAYMTSLLGVVKMWELKKYGFYIYATVNGLGLTYDLISGSYFMAFITIAFLGMYISNFKHLK